MSRIIKLIIRTSISVLFHKDLKACQTSTFFPNTSNPSCHPFHLLCFPSTFKILSDFLFKLFFLIIHPFSFILCSLFSIHEGIHYNWWLCTLFTTVELIKLVLLSKVFSVRPCSSIYNFLPFLLKTVILIHCLFRRDTTL